MTNKTITLDRAVAERLVSAVDNGALFRPGDVEALRAALAEPVPRASPTLVSYAEDMSTCTLTTGDGTGYFYDRVCADPVPPVGGDDLVECDACPTSGGCVRTCMKADPAPPTVGNPEIQRWLANWHMEDFYKSPHGTHVDYEDHAAIVTLLQAEVKRLKALRAESHVNFLDYSDLLHDVACSHNWVISDELRTRITETLNIFATPGQAPAYSYAAIRKERDALKSELTKARELLTEVQPCVSSQVNGKKSALRAKIDAFLSNQSAPALIKTLHANGDRIAMEATIAQQAQRIADLEAGKGQGEPLIHITPEVLAMLRGERKMMAGGLTYSQSKPVGNWTVPLYAEQPTPVAADDCDKALMDRHEAWKAGEANGIASMMMPERRISPPLGPDFYARGWNACLDEVARLNSEPQP